MYRTLKITFDLSTFLRGLLQPWFFSYKSVIMVRSGAVIRNFGSGYKMNRMGEK